jgi:hypothetical protein
VKSQHFSPIAHIKRTKLQVCLQIEDTTFAQEEDVNL